MGRDTRIVGKEALASTSISTFPDADTVELPRMHSDCITSKSFHLNQMDLMWYQIKQEIWQCTQHLHLK